MSLSKSKLKFLSSLKLKKYRTEFHQFIMEGDKIIKDALKSRNPLLKEIIALPDWFPEHEYLTNATKIILTETNAPDLKRISSLESPPPVIAVFEIPESPLKLDEVFQSMSLCLDTIQDPGNLGTIIRTADWFGVNKIICSKDCADAFNPKVVQSSMGAILNVQMYYADLAEILKSCSTVGDFMITGTFMEGIPLKDLHFDKRGTILFGNESKGISPEILPYIRQKVTIPSKNKGNHVESLNVASSVAIILSHL